MEVFSNIPREAVKRACSCFLSRLEKVVSSKGDFIRKMYSPNLFMKVYICFKKRASIPLAPCIFRMYVRNKLKVQKVLCHGTASQIYTLKVLFGTDPDQNRVT
jgi:hypothetical protein